MMREAFVPTKGEVGDRFRFPHHLTDTCHLRIKNEKFISFALHFV